MLDGRGREGQEAGQRLILENNKKQMATLFRGIIVLNVDQKVAYPRSISYHHSLQGTK